MLFELFNECNDDTGYISCSHNGNYKTRLDGQTLYIFFQKSSGLMDWLSNFDFASKPYKRMDNIWRCHRGFLRVWRGMRDEITERVRKEIVSHGVNSVVCVGYSHGGALCALAVEDIMYQYGSNISVEGYGFGAPRVVYGRIPPEVRKRFECYHLIRNQRDIVPHLPPKFLGYKDADTIVTLPYDEGLNPIAAHKAGAYVFGLKKLRNLS